MTNGCRGETTGCCLAAMAPDLVWSPRDCGADQTSGLKITTNIIITTTTTTLYTVLCFCFCSKALVPHVGPKPSSREGVSDIKFYFLRGIFRRMVGLKRAE